MKKLFLSILLFLSVLFSFATEINRYKVYSVIKSLEIQFPEIVLAQAILESGNFKSKIAKNGHNIFGMKMPKKRKTIASGVYKGYAKYCCWEESVYDYKLWQKSKKFRSKNEYLKYLAKVYCKTPNYISKLKKIIKQNENRFIRNINQYS